MGTIECGRQQTFMNTFFKINRPATVLLTMAVLVIVVGVLPLRMGYAAAVLSDVEKRQKIEKMYVDYQKAFPEIPDMDPRQAMRLVKERKIVFIDVRESKEQLVSMLPEAVTAEAYLENPDKYKAHLKIAYCTIAYRSGKFAQKLKDRGITILNLRGGILAWVHDGGKVYGKHGQTNRIHVYGRKWDLVPNDYEAVW
jgi:sodium/bile acid cotransporter 7